MHKLYTYSVILLLLTLGGTATVMAQMVDCNDVCTDTCDYPEGSSVDVSCIELRCTADSPDVITVTYFLNEQQRTITRECNGQNDDCDDIAPPLTVDDSMADSGISPFCDVSPWGACQGGFLPWNKQTHRRNYVGEECRTRTCSGQVFEDCRACNYEETDFRNPVCESVVDWESRPIESVVLGCEDDISGCDGTSYENGQIDGTRTEVLPARACDEAGNCVDCPITNPDNIAPTCTATFRHPGRWHRSDEFEANGGDLKCWLEACEDEGPSGCLPLEILENTEKVFNDPGGMVEQLQVEQDALDPVHRDTCTIEVCDNAGNCDTCESPEIAYDGTDVCRAADQNCSNCGEDDWDCRCISGERDKCTNSGPVNCYADPFNPRCPGFENEACLANAFIPGCPVFNPCYPEINREHPRAEDLTCPADAIRFCSRNPYHYGCNEACKLGLIECDPDVPEGELLSSRLEAPASRVQSAEVDRPNCPALGDCPSGWNWVREGVDEDGCILARCEEIIEIASVPEGPMVGATCSAILDMYPDAEDGVYTIDPDGDGPNLEFEAYCDMTTDGGGWTVIDPQRSGTWSQYFTSWNEWDSAVAGPAESPSSQSWRGWFAIDSIDADFGQASSCATVDGPGNIYKMTGDYYGCFWYTTNCPMEGEECRRCQDPWRQRDVAGSCTHMGSGPDSNYAQPEGDAWTCSSHWWNSAPSLGLQGRYCVAWRDGDM